MTRSLLKSTTAVALAISLAIPLPVAAQSESDVLQQRLERLQQQGGAEEEIQQLREQLGNLTEGQQDSAAPEADAQAQADAQAEADAQAQAEADAQAAQEAQAEAERRAAEEAQAQAEAEAQAAEAERRAEAERQAAEEAQAQAEAEAAEAERQAEADRRAAEEAQAQAEADAQAEAERQAAEQQAAEHAQAQAQADAEAQAQAQAQAAADAEARATENDAQADASTNEATQTQVEGDTPSSNELAEELQRREAESGTDATVGATADTAQAGATADTAQDSNGEELTAEQQNQLRLRQEQERAREQDAPRTEEQELEEARQQAEAVEEVEEAAPVAAMAADTGEATDVVEERVTEETARSSADDFPTQTAGAQTEARASSGDNNNRMSGTDRFFNTVGKAAVAGLGAYAVGSLLNNGRDRVVSNTGDRVIVERNGDYRVLRDDDVLLRRPGSDVQTYTFDDGSTRTVVMREDGSQVQTIRAADGRVLRRTRILPDGREFQLFDDTRQFERVNVAELPRYTESRSSIDLRRAEENQLRRALEAEVAQGVNRTFSLAQIRQIDAVRRLVPEVEVDNINFQTGSAAIRPAEAEELAALGRAMRDAIRQDPGQVFLVEGHTDAVGSAASNLALSDRRAESLALALSEYFDVPPENMVVQGYGESDLKVQTSGPSEENRRAAVRNITRLLSNR